MSTSSREKKIKVAEFVTRLESGGVEAMLLNYISHFSKRSSFDIHIVTQDINDQRCVKRFISLGCTVNVVTHKRKSIVRNVSEIYRLMRHERFDVVHSHMTLMNFYVMFLSKLCKVPIRISHSHNIFTSNNYYVLFLWTILKYVNKLFSNIWVACGADAGRFLYGKNAVESGRVLLLKNAIDISRFAYSGVERQLIRSKLGLGDNLCIGHIGRFTRQKNHKMVVNIFQQFHKKRPDSRLLLIGTGELEGLIKEYVSSLKLDDAVLFMGSVDDSSKYYQAMDVFILPSLFEGLPVVMIEAQANGLPIILSQNIDKSCILSNNVIRLPIENSDKRWTDAISQVCGQRNIDSLDLIRAAHYDIDIEARRLEELYQR